MTDINLQVRYTIFDQIFGHIDTLLTLSIYFKSTSRAENNKDRLNQDSNPGPLE